MEVVAVVVGFAFVSALIGGFVAWRLPDFDPAAPKLSRREIEREVRLHPRLATLVRSRVDPSTATGLALTVAFVLVFGGALVTGALLVMVQHNAGLARWDLSAARWGGSHASKGSTDFLRYVSLLGGTPGMIVAALVTAIAIYIRTRRTVVVWFLVVVVGGQSIVSNLTKLIVDRSRPDIDRLTGFSGSSFPSGHATAAAATFAAIALLWGIGQPRRTKVLLAGAAVAVGTAVAASRVLLGVHWLTDVLAGLALGWAWFAISSIAFGGRLLSFGRPARIAQHAADAIDPPGGNESEGVTPAQRARPSVRIE
jgi:membrane-associated phospholipid phosphatase